MGSCSYSTECKKEVHYTLIHNTIITAVHNNSTQQQYTTAVHMTHRLPELQVTLTMISVLAVTLTSQC